MTEALVCIDWINEVAAAADGKLAAAGYRTFIETNNTLERMAERQRRARREGGRVIHVHIGFDPSYAEYPRRSPLITGAPDAGILRLETRSTQFMAEVAPADDDIVIVKKRISPFYGTSLELTLRALGVTGIVVAGISTDLAVQSAARDAHDRDLRVTVAAGCCVAATQTEHDAALDNMAKFAAIE